MNDEVKKDLVNAFSGNTSIEEQSNKARNWCTKYDIKINLKSNFLK